MPPDPQIPEVMPVLVPQPEPAPSSAPLPVPLGQDLGALLNAFGGMQLPAVRHAQQQAQAFGPPMDPATALAGMPDIEDTGGQQPIFQPQPPGVPLVQVAQGNRRQRRQQAALARTAEPEPDPEPESEPTGDGGEEDDLPPAKAIVQASEDIDALVEDVENGKMTVRDAFLEMAEIMSDTCLDVLALQQQLLERQLGPVNASVVSSVGASQAPTLSSPPAGFPQQEAIMVLQAVMASVTFVQGVTGVHQKQWVKYLQSIPSQAQAILGNLAQQLPALLSQAHEVIQARSGVSATDLLRGVDPAQVEEAARSMGIQAPSELLRQGR